jgi:tetratricopeptide (TPR) repeat protein
MILLISATCLAGMAQRGHTVETAYTLMEAGKWAEAEKELATQLAADPADTARLAAFAYVAAQQGKRQVAIDYARRALKIEPKTTFARNVLALNLIAVGKRDEGIRELQSLVELAPQDAVAQRNLGLACFQAGLPQKAIPFLEKSLSASSEDRALRVDLMAAYLQVGDSQRALRLIKTAPQDPLFPELACRVLNENERFNETVALLEPRRASEQLSPAEKLLLAEAWAGQGSFENALSVLDTIPQQDRNAEYAVKLAWAYTTRDQLPKAVEILQKAIRDNLNEEKLYDALANVFLGGSAPQDAIDAAEQGLAAHPESAALLLTLGVAEEYLGRHERCQGALLKCIEKDPSNGYAYYVLALSYRISGKDWNQTAAMFERALQIRPNDPLIKSNYARELIRNGQIARAQKMAQSLLHSPGYEGSAHRILGQVCMKKGQWVEAVAALERALKLEPENQEAVYHLATSYNRLGQREKAQEYFSMLKDVKESEREKEEQRAILVRLAHRF